MDIFKFNSKVKSFEEIFFDSHCHIQFDDIDESIDSIVLKAQQAGLNKLVVVGIDHKSTLNSLDIQEQFPGFCYSTLGNHPYNADKDCKFILDLLDKYPESFCAIGETGLDYFKNNLKKEIQIESFYNHCEIAKRFDLPVIIHLREYKDCIEDCLSVLKQTGTQKAIFHCFTSDPQDAKKLWEKGYKTSFALLTFYPKNKHILEAFQKCPLDNLLIETDTPYLPPKNMRGKQNKPYFLKDFLEFRQRSC